jgi:hypothetical protein
MASFNSVATSASAGFMKQLAKLIAISALCLIAFVWGRYLFLEARADSTYTNAQVGDAEEAIVTKLGVPDQVLPCGKYLWWNGDQENPPRNIGQCKKWVRYNFFLHAFAFGYSSDGTLVSRYEYSSE